MPTNPTNGKTKTQEAPPNARFDTITANRIVIPGPDGKPAIELFTQVEDGVDVACITLREGTHRAKLYVEQSATDTGKRLHRAGIEFDAGNGTACALRVTGIRPELLLGDASLGEFCDRRHRDEEDDAT